MNNIENNKSLDGEFAQDSCLNAPVKLNNLGLFAGEIWPNDFRKVEQALDLLNGIETPIGLEQHPHLESEQ